MNKDETLLKERGTQMFGIGKKQEELEHELLAKQAEADKYLKKLSEVTNKMRLVQNETETGIASMEGSQNELDSQMEKLTETVKDAAGEAKRQNIRNRELQKQIVVLANKAGLADGTYQRSIEGIYRREKELLEMIEQGESLPLRKRYWNWRPQECARKWEKWERVSVKWKRWRSRWESFL